MFGQVMGLVALTLGCLALGAYIGRDLSGGWGILFFIAGFRMRVERPQRRIRARERAAFDHAPLGLGLLLGLALGPVLELSQADPAAIWQAAGATGGFVASLGAAQLRDHRDLSSWYRVLFWALLGLIVFGLVDLRLDPGREPDLGDRRARHLRRLHDPRLQPAPPDGQGGRGADRGEHLPGRAEHLPVLPAAVQVRKARWSVFERVHMPPYGRTS